MYIKRWFLALMELLSNVYGQDEGEAAVDEGTDDKGTEGDAEGEGEGEGDEGGDAGDDSGKDVGKDRSKYIPRERFDKVNAKAQRIETLVASGVLAEDEDGNLRINPQALKNIAGEKDEGKSDKVSFRFTKDEVEANSWPLVEKINKAYDHYDDLTARLHFAIAQLGSQLRMVGDYPEFIQKNSPLKKLALEIMKDDPEFKKTYRGNPEALYWATKRAAERLTGKEPPKTKPAKKPGFIVGKGDVGGKGEPKTINITSLMTSPEGRKKLDEYEQAEHERLESSRKQAKKK